MRLLLDTHTWVWAAAEPDRLGKKTRAMLIQQKTERLVSAVSVLEIARLNANGHMVLSLATAAWIEQASKILLLDHLSVTSDIAIEAYALPAPFHRDPADRLLVATTRLLNLTLLTADERILQYRFVRALDCRK
jgi:PIN domain nuclease of toxin-antitoxin system